MLLTSYFAKAAKHPGALPIACFPPKWYAGARYLPLAPKPEMLKVNDGDEYRCRYWGDVLDRLDPDQVLKDLSTLCPGNDIVLLCFEKDRTHCHRGLVAEWLFRTKGIAVPERADESPVQRSLDG
jgi:hypothetical protein